MYVNLSQLAFAAYIYDATADDDSIAELNAKIGPTPDLTKRDTANAILEWLNDWQCRLCEEEFDTAIAELKKWQKAFGSELASIKSNLLELNDSELNNASLVYADLFKRKANQRRTFGPTATTKTLFILRQNALPAWDKAIREGLEFDDKPSSYLLFLKHSQKQLQELKTSCKAAGVDIADVPKLVNRPNSSLAKLVDEYNWVTITRGFEPPDCMKLSQWLGWASGIPAGLKSALEALPKMKQTAVGKA